MKQSLNLANHFAMLLMALAMAMAFLACGNNVQKDVSSWPQMSVDKFGCMMEETFGYRHEIFNCSLEGYANNPDKCDDGFPFPDSLVKKVHPSLSNVALYWQHGKLQEIRLYFKGGLTYEQLLKAFGLWDKPQPNNINFMDVREDYLSLTGFSRMGIKCLQGYSGEVKLEEYWTIFMTTAKAKVDISFGGKEKGYATIAWGDGAVENGWSNNSSHNYGSTSLRTIAITSQDITGFACRGNELTELDVSQNTVLSLLYCSNNQLTNLDVSKNTALRYIDVSNNRLTDYALNDLFNTLHSTGGEIKINDNPGTDKCDRSIATKKGWRFYEESQSDSEEEDCPDKTGPLQTAEVTFLKEYEDHEGRSASIFRLANGDEIHFIGDTENLKKGDKVSITYRNIQQPFAEACWNYNLLESVKVLSNVNEAVETPHESPGLSEEGLL